MLNLVTNRYAFHAAIQIEMAIVWFSALNPLCWLEQSVDFDFFLFAVIVFRIDFLLFWSIIICRQKTATRMTCFQTYNDIRNGISVVTMLSFLLTLNEFHTRSLTLIVNIISGLVYIAAIFSFIGQKVVVIDLWNYWKPILMTDVDFVFCLGFFILYLQSSKDLCDEADGDLMDTWKHLVMFQTYFRNRYFMNASFVYLPNLFICFQSWTLSLLTMPSGVCNSSFV